MLDADQTASTASAVTADEFLIEIFAGIPGRVVLCKPNAKGHFDQQFWQPGLCAALPAGCWYFAISTVHGPAEDGKVRRRYVDLRRTACLVLDDVGTRIRCEAVTLAPSWVLKTSVKLWDHAIGKEAPDGAPTDNMQVGYILDSGMNPASARLLLEALKKNDALKDAVLTAGTQPFRLPGSLNLKHDPPFASRLILWDPQTRYLPSEIARHYDLPPKPKPVVETSLVRRFPDGGDPVWRALQRGNYLLSDKPRQGWYPIKCPWQDEHREHSMDGKPDSGIAYKPRHAGLGASFKCFHSSCTARGWRDLYDLLVRP